MQNKPNFRNALMNVSTILTVDYKNIANWTLGENKPNQTQFYRNFASDYCGGGCGDLLSLKGICA